MGVQRRDQGHQEPGPQAGSEGKASQAASKDGWISVTNSCQTLCDPMDWLARLLCPWDSPGKSSGVGCHFLLQGIFPTQGSNPSLLYCRWILHH